MGSVTGSAFVILSRLMFKFGIRQEVIVATEAKFGLRRLHSHGKSRLMAIRAFVLFVGRVRDELLNHDRCRRGIGARSLGPLDSGGVVIQDLRRGIRGSRHRNAIEEKGQPLSFAVCRTPQEHQQAPRQNYHHGEAGCDSHGT